MAGLVSARASLGRRYVFCLASTLATLAGGCNSVFGIHEGTPQPPCYDPGPSPLLIDDMEDGVGDICNLGGRQGYWYTAGDGAEGTLSPAQGATFTPTMIPGGRGSSHYAARFTGSGFTGWGALMGLNLDTVGLMNQTVNASSTSGITFWMKNDVPVSVDFLIPDTVLQTAGGNCVPSASNPNCSSHFSFEITAPNADWVQFQVPFAALTQQYGGTATWNPQLLLGIQFEVAPGAAFDVWVDDISFYYCSTGACLPTCADPAFPVSCQAGGSYPAGCWSAKTDCSAVATWCSNPLLIDDMEDGNAAICNSGARQGSWGTAGDGSPGTLSPAPGATFTMTPIPGGRGESLRAAHMTGSGFTAGAAMGFSIGGLGATPGPYDASATGGVTFWIKAAAPWVELQFPTSETVPVSDGGLCSDGATTNNCQNYFVFEIPSPSNEWVQYHVPYSALYQAFAKSDADGNLIVGSATWDPTSLDDVLFNVLSSASFELWIDDVSFYSCTNETCLPTCSDPTTIACPALGAVPASCWPAGTDCSNVSRLLANPPLIQVWGSGASAVWAVGGDLRGSQTASATLLHWDGSVWSSLESGAAHPLWGVWGSSAADVWAVGDFGTIVHWNGTAWSASSSGVSGSSLRSVWGSSSDDVWAVGANGAIVHWDGATWSVSTSASTNSLYHLWGSAADDVWAVGDGGTILHYDGTAWSPSASGTASALGGVWGSSSSDVYAVGATTTGEATILHWNGATWSTVSTPAAGYPNGVWGSGPGDVWIVGDSILHFDGATWSAVPSPTGAYLRSVWGSGPSDAWIVGDLGTLLRWNGSTWSVVPTAGIQQ